MICVMIKINIINIDNYIHIFKIFIQNNLKLKMSRVYFSYFFKKPDYFKLFIW